MERGYTVERFRVSVEREGCTADETQRVGQTGMQLVSPSPCFHL